MELQEAFELSGVILGLLGGGATIVFGFSSWLGRIWANQLMARDTAKYAEELASLRNSLTQETERYKIKLKKSEFIFQKEFEAASEFVAMLREISPSHSRPLMDFDGACDDIAQDFHKIEVALGIFLSRNGAVLQRDAKEAIYLCIAIAGETKFEITSPDVPRVANQAAGELYNKLQEVEQYLLNQVHSQASI
jgi:hypothetical protein